MMTTAWPPTPPSWMAHLDTESDNIWSSMTGERSQRHNCLPCVNLTEGKRPRRQKSFETKVTLVTDISFHFCTPNSSHPRIWTLRAPSPLWLRQSSQQMRTAHSSCHLSPVITTEQEPQLPCKVIPVVNRPSVWESSSLDLINSLTARLINSRSILCGDGKTS